jgi:TrpR-related protein YerC/YecD
MKHPTAKEIDDLYAVILQLETVNESRKVFRDLMTETEIQEMAERWKVAQMLASRISYMEIEKETGLSSRTIGRVAQSLKQGRGEGRNQKDHSKGRKQKNWRRHSLLLLRLMHKLMPRLLQGLGCADEMFFHQEDVVSIECGLRKDWNVCRCERNSKRGKDADFAEGRRIGNADTAPAGF